MASNNKMKEPIHELRSNIGYGKKRREILRLLQDPIQTEICRLFSDEHLYAHEIEKRLNGQLALDEELKEPTRSQIVREVITHSIPTEERIAIEKIQWERTYRHRVNTPAKLARDRYQRKIGCVVFTDTELEYMLKIRKQKRMQKGPIHCDNEKIANAMNDRFCTSRFTADNCRQKFANYNIALRKRTERSQEIIAPTVTKAMINPQGEGHFLLSVIRWTMLSAELETIDVNQDILSRAISTIEGFLKTREWEHAINIICATYSKYTPDVIHILEFVLACCYLETGKTQDAEFAFRRCAEYKSGPLIGRIQQARQSVNSNPVADIFCKLNEATAVPPLVVVPPEDLGEVALS